MAEPGDKEHEQTPAEDAKPNDCVAPADDCEHQDAKATGEDEQGGDFSWRDELAEAFPLTAIRHVLDPSDGLPVPAEDDTRLNLAITFSHENLVCIEDDREWVELFAEEAYWDRGSLSRVCSRSRYDAEGKEVERRTFKPKDVLARFGMKVVLDPDSGPIQSFIPVRPIRPQCAHYMRQVMPNDDERDQTALGSKIMMRACAARRSNGGAYMSLRDEGVFACSLRSPRDLPSEHQHLVVPDKRRLEVIREEVPLFGLAAKPLGGETK